MNPAGTENLSLIHDYLGYWARMTPENPAVIQHESGWSISYRELNELVDLYALCLLNLGVRKGERVAAMGLQSIQYIALQYACFKLGVIICPLDIKLKHHEAIRSLDQITPRLFFMHGATPMRDFNDVGRAILEECSYVSHVLQFNLTGNEPILEGAKSANNLFNIDVLRQLAKNQALIDQRDEMYRNVEAKDAALIIFTTGTTGNPKPALLQHECIVAQMEIALRGFDVRGTEQRRLCMLPTSHVGGTTISVYTGIYAGGTDVLLYVFRPDVAMEAIGKWQCTWIGGVPTMYRMMWALPNYDDYDISSLRCAYYAGAAADKPFLDRIAEMAPYFGTALGMTESGGVGTYTPRGATADELLGQVGCAAEDIARISIRKMMNADGTNGAECPDGEIGEICYHPPLVFLGYFEQADETAKVISQEGVLYSGDLGLFKQMGDYRGLFLKGRSKFMIKQKGYNVFPNEVADCICMMPGIAEAQVVGVRHSLFDEGIVAFVIPKRGMKINAEQVLEYCRVMASYKRPQHVEVLSEETVFPLNNNGKVNRDVLTKFAEKITEELRLQGKWDKNI